MFIGTLLTQEDLPASRTHARVTRDQVALLVLVQVGAVREGLSAPFDWALVRSLSGVHPEMFDEVLFDTERVVLHPATFPEAQEAGIGFAGVLSGDVRDYGLGVREHFVACLRVARCVLGNPLAYLKTTDSDRYSASAFKCAVLPTFLFNIFK